jgi:hypothetical protein
MELRRQFAGAERQALPAEGVLADFVWPKDL